MAGLFFSFVFAVAGYFIYRSGLWKVREVYVSFVDRAYEPQKVSDFIRRGLLGRSLVFSEQNFGEAIQREFKTVKRTEIRKSLTGRIFVRLWSRHPLAALYPWPDGEGRQFEASASALARLNSEADRIYRERPLTDESGLLFISGSPRGLPKIFLPAGRIKLGASLNGSPFDFILSLLQKLNELGLPAASLIELDEKDILVFTKREQLIFISADKDLSLAQKTLSLIFEKYGAEGKNLSKIDLRFKNPVVEFK